MGKIKGRGVGGYPIWRGVRRVDGSGDDTPSPPVLWHKHTCRTNATQSHAVLSGITFLDSTGISRGEWSYGE